MWTPRGGSHVAPTRSSSPAARQGRLLAEPGEDREVERQQERDRGQDRAAAEVDERAVGQRKNDDPEDEPAATRQESEQGAAAEDHEWRRVHRDGQRVRKPPRQHQHGRNRKEQRGSEERRCQFRGGPPPEPSNRRPVGLKKQGQYQTEAPAKDPMRPGSSTRWHGRRGTRA